MSIYIDVPDIHVVPVDATFELDFFFLMVEHMEAHVVDFHLPDMEKFLLAVCLPAGLLYPEDSGEAFSGLVSVSHVGAVLQHEIHLRVAQEYLVEMKSVLPEQSLKSEPCNDILGCEEGVYLFTCPWVRNRIPVGDPDILEDEGGEWLEVYLFEVDVSLKLV